MRYLVATGLFVVAFAAPLRAQLVVIDPANLAQAILIADRTAREYEALLEQYQTIVRMARGLGNLDAYRIPTIGTTSHDTGRWGTGARGCRPEYWRRGGRGLHGVA